MNLFLIIVFQVFGAFKEAGIGARYSSLARAGTALADDSYAIFINPAGIAQLATTETSFETKNYFLGTKKIDIPGYLSPNWKTQLFTFVTPLPESLGSVGFGLINFDVAGYSENTYILSFAYNITQIPLKVGEQIYLGANIKALEQKFPVDSYTEKNFSIYGKNSNTLTVDLGFIYKFIPFGVGINIRNLYPAELGLIEKEKLSRDLQIGFEYDLPIKEMLLVSDISFRDATLKPLFHIGSEIQFFNKKLSLRFGINPAEFASGISFRIKSPDLQLGFTHTLPFFVKDTIGNILISLTLRSGKFFRAKPVKIEIPKEVPEVIIEEAPPPPPTPPPAPPPSPEEIKLDRIKQHWAEGMKLFNQEKYEEAILEFEEILKLKPDHLPSQIRIKICKDRIEEKRKIKKVISPEDLEKIREHFSKGIELYLLENYKEALKEFYECLKINPEHEPSKIRIKMILEKMKR